MRLGKAKTKIQSPTTPGVTAGMKRDTFWARQSPRDKIALGAIGFEIAVSLVLIVAGLRLDNKVESLPSRFTILTGNVVVLLAALQFAILRLFEDQREKIDGLGRELGEVKVQIAKSVTEMESITSFGETYGKISRQADVVRNQYQSTLDNFLTRLSNCIDERRSGALDVMDYYGALEDLAAALASDRLAAEAVGGDYGGEIWALSFVLDDEWDDSNPLEVKWFATLEDLDKSGIHTRRLWAFDKKMVSMLSHDPLGAEGRELIRRLSLYCADNTPFQNTTSVAVPKELISDDHVKVFGKGFFAGAFADGDLSLIRGVCFDNLLSSNSLGGEIDFDLDRIALIRRHWTRYLGVGKPLKDYLAEVGGPDAIAYMKQLWSIGTP